MNSFFLIMTGNKITVRMTEKEERADRHPVSIGKDTMPLLTASELIECIIAVCITHESRNNELSFIEQKGAGIVGLKQASCGVLSGANYLVRNGRNNLVLITKRQKKLKNRNEFQSSKDSFAGCFADPDNT